jgi:hypothetical protein
MKDKILDRLSKIGGELNDLAIKKQELIKELKQIDMNMEVLSGIAYELKDLLETEGKEQ